MLTDEQIFVGAGEVRLLARDSQKKAQASTTSQLRNVGLHSSDGE